MVTFEQYADFLAGSARRAMPEIDVALARVGALARTMAVEYIGHELPSWPPLAASTVAQKQRLGFVGRVSATDPLLRTGEMRDSIAAEVVPYAVVVGSPLDKAMWQELGTSRIPPRPFLALAMQSAAPLSEDAFYDAAVALLVPLSERGRA
jgi:hypothetical protein